MATTEVLYVESATSLQERYTRLTNIITALETQFLNTAAGNSDIEEYSLDDGQVRIKTIYRSPEAITKAIDRFEYLRQRTLNQMNGRTVELKDWRGLL